MQHRSTRLLTLTGVFAAIIFLLTYVIHIPIGTGGGYIHFGDAAVYLAACVLPLPYAMLASAIGAGLSDVLVPGGMIWLPATLLLKPLCCLPFSQHSKTIISRRRIAGLFIAGMITVIGYAVATAIIFGNVATAILELPLSMIQPIGSGICFVAVGLALDKTALFNCNSI